MEWELDHGRRQCIQVLGLLERYSLQQLTSAVQEAQRRRVHSKDGIEQFLTGYLLADTTCRPTSPSDPVRARMKLKRAVYVSPLSPEPAGNLIRFDFGFFSA